MKQAFASSIIYLTILAVGSLGLPVATLAAPIGTDALIELQQRGQLISRIQAQTTRDDVRAQFIAHGVAPSEVDARIAAMTTAELQVLSTRLDTLPAGGSVLGVVGAVFVVLLILELVGVTNVFTAI